jgi:D-glycero-alpha-D-manno-heptose 1-phosphate guanylyltransferase
MITEAIVLAGGLGTKIPGTVPELPKCMATVGGRPFLFYVINYLRGEGIEKFIFSLGYKHEVIEKYLEEQFPTLQYESVIEGEPLGTGGAVRLACIKVTGEHVIIVNGDTFFEADLSKAFDFHLLHQAECTILLKPMSDFDN